MDRKPEDLRFLGIAGILEEAFKILRSRPKLLGSLTFSLVLPLSVAILGYLLVFQYVLFHWNEMPYLMENTNPAGETMIKAFTLERAVLVLFLAAYSEIVLAFSLLPTAAVVYTVASVYTSKEICYGRVMSIVLRVWKRLMRTFLWVFIIFFVYCVASPLVSVLLVSNVVLFNLNLAAIQFIITGVFASALLYITMVWHLACATSVLEDEYGVGAIRKSRYLRKGKLVTTLLLDILYAVFVANIVCSFAFGVLNKDHHGVLGAGIGAYRILLVVLLCFVHLMGLLTQSVLYFVCKSYHHESIDKSSSSDHLEGYVGDYEPLKGSNAELEEGIAFL